MKKFLTGKVRFILITALFLAIVLAVVGAVTGGASMGEKAAGAALNPFRSGMNAIAGQVERVYDYIFRYELLAAENDALKDKIAAMEEDVRNAQGFARENERLKNALNLQEEHEDFVLLSAYITSWDASNWKSACTIAKGTKSGVQEGMCAVTEYGQVVGVVTAVGASWATITTILDPATEISASITASGYTGVVQGSYENDNSLRMNYLPSDAVLRNNDQVVTTGSTLYPKGLILGYIADAGMDETGVGKHAVLTAAADFDGLEQIFLVAQYQS